jgi:DNA-binding transcriptional LysR family regulator
VIGTPAYFEAAGMPLTPTDLLQHQAIIYEQRDGGATGIFRQTTLETAVTLSGRLRFSAGEVVREAVLAGLGFVLGSEWLFAPELNSGAVISALDDWSLPSVNLWAVFPAGRQACVKARAFASFIEDQLHKNTSAVPT